VDLRISVEGDQHVPTAGPVVLASNHVSFVDFLLVGLAAPAAAYRRARRLLREGEAVGLFPEGGDT